MQQLIPIGIALILLGFVIVIAGILLSAKSTETSIRGGGVVFLGPIPLIFGTDRSSAIVVAVLAIILMSLFYLFFRR